MATKPPRTKIETFLDNLAFGPYVSGDNDCDVMAVKAREAIKIAHPQWETGICIMYGISLPQFARTGHGILVVKCIEGDLYYDCTTQSGNDSSRFRQIGWMSTWVTYLVLGFFIFFSYTEWEDYTPAARFKRWKKLSPR
jgi:hypothetical protein